jgi:hypothetical protein
MPTLSLVKGNFIKALKWIGIIILILIALLLLFKGALALKEKIRPTPPPKPTVGFGKLPAQFFPNDNKKVLTYKVDTLDGKLPVFSNRNKVYEMEKPTPNILAIDRANSILSQQGFNPEPEQLADRVFRWVNYSPPEKSLVLNVDNQEFILSSSFISDPTILAAVNLPNKNSAINTAKSFFNSLSLFPDDIDENKTTAQLLRMKNGALLPASSLSNAQLISVFFFQKDKDDMPIVYSQGKWSPINATVASGGRNSQIIDARYFHQKSLEKFETYPIKSAEAALEDLKKGKGFIANYEGTGNEVKIKNVYLAYYHEGREQDYLMPVVVFEGGDNFLAYVPAITDEWINN